MRKISLIFVLFIFLIPSLTSAYPEGWSDDIRLTNDSSGCGFVIRDFYIDDSGNYCIIYWDCGKEVMKYTMINTTGHVIIDGKIFFKWSEDVPGDISSDYDGNFYSFLHSENTIFAFGSMRKAEPSVTEICLLGLDYSGNITIPLTFISEDDARYSLYPMIDFDDYGNILCFWIDAKGSDREARWDEKSLFYAKLSINGTVLVQPKKIISLTYEGNHQQPIHPSYIFDKNHNLYFFWVRETNNIEHISRSLMKILSNGAYDSKKDFLDYELLYHPTASVSVSDEGKIHFITCASIDVNPEGIPKHRDFFNYYILDENLNEIFSSNLTFYDEGYYWTKKICDSKIKNGDFHVIFQSTFETYKTGYISKLYEIKYFANSQTEPTFARISELDGFQSKEPKLYGYNDELFLIWSDNKHSSDTLNDHEIYMKTTGNLSFSQVTYPSETEDESDSMFEPETSEDKKGEGDGTPGFELILVMLSIALFLFWKRRM